MWDIYSLAAITLECDMERDAYLTVMSEKIAKIKVKEYLEEKGTCEHLKNLLRRTILCANIHDMLDLDTMLEIIGKISFRKLGKNLKRHWEH